MTGQDGNQFLDRFKYLWIHTNWLMCVPIHTFLMIQRFILYSFQTSLACRFYIPGSQGQYFRKSDFNIHNFASHVSFVSFMIHNSISITYISRKSYLPPDNCNITCLAKLVKHKITIIYVNP